MSGGRRHRFYIDPNGLSPPTDVAPEPGHPRPGHGTIYVAARRDGTWSASWQDEPGQHRMATVEGDREQVGLWVRSQPAASVLVFSPALDDYIPWSPAEGDLPDE